MKYDIFLSYSHRDSHIAHELEAKISARGLRCFMAEKTLQGGDEWLSTVREGIENSRRIIILVTPRSLNSAWIHLETGAAWMGNKEIIPLLHFVEPSELTDIARIRHATRIETEAEKVAFVSSLAGQGGDDPPRQMTMDLVLEKISVAKSRMSQDTFYPNLVVGSGKGGALCAAVFASQLGHHPLKVVDCELPGCSIDDSTLRREDILGKRVLVVEWARKTGRTYRLIKDKILALEPSDLRAYALFWTQATDAEVPHYYGEICKSVPQNPWGTY